MKVCVQSLFKSGPNQLYNTNFSPAKLFLDIYINQETNKKSKYKNLINYVVTHVFVKENSLPSPPRPLMETKM